MYNLDESDHSSDENDADSTGDAAGEESKEASKVKKSYGALGFKPKLEEYLIESSEEAMADTLFYVRHARRLAAAQ